MPSNTQNTSKSFVYFRGLINFVLEGSGDCGGDENHLVIYPFSLKTNIICNYIYYLIILLCCSLPNGRISETFHTTPVTSTYLLAFIVSHYQVVSSNNDANRPFHIYARDNAANTGDWSLEIGELLLARMEQHTNFSYYGMAENMDMKQAAIPDFSAGAMENWGLLTYR